MSRTRYSALGVRATSPTLGRRCDKLEGNGDHYVGIRPYDNCFNNGPLTVTKLTTLERQAAEVSACFIATAAYGSVVANDVQMLRKFRDSVLARTVIGELAVETYYTFSPPVAGVIGESDLLRASARAVLEPIVATVRRLGY